MPNPVVHFEIITKDPKVLGEFFRDAFGWSVDRHNTGTGAGDVSEYIMALPTGVEPAKAGINGGFGEAPEGYDGHVTFYIGVDDVGGALEKIERLGGTRMMGPQQVPNGPVIGLFNDPQGHVIGLVKDAP